MNIAIVGMGYVGTAMNKLFKQAVIYDEPKGIGSREEVNKCYAAFVCVPTPQGADGKCLPKDVAALINQANELGADATFMKAVQEKNEQYR